MDSILTVSALTEILRDTLEKRVPFVWVRGEITNLSRPQSGHIYFSLKDSRSQIACVWFAGRQGAAGEKFDPLTGEVFEEPRQSLAEEMANGMEILCAGSIGIYAQKGQYQLKVELAQPVGMGELARQFERLRAKLDAAGYFRLERKRALPENPVRIALVTSPAGAAIHDFLELAQSRGVASEIRLFPVQVQGDGAARMIANAIRLINLQDWAQVIVLIRGGGSLEDLWAFNEETLAEAIFNSRLPVLAGIGHEVDFTLSDLTADVRAATPSHAAQLLWPERTELWQRLDDAESALARAINMKIDALESSLSHLSDVLGWLSPKSRLERLELRLNPLADKLDWQITNFLTGCEDKYRYLQAALQPAMQRLLSECEVRFVSLESSLKATDPRAPLGRGYALLFNEAGLVRSASDARLGENLRVMLEDGRLLVKVIEMETRDSGGEIER